MQKAMEPLAQKTLPLSLAPPSMANIKKEAPIRKVKPPMKTAINH